MRFIDTPGDSVGRVALSSNAARHQFCVRGFLALLLVAGLVGVLRGTLAAWYARTAKIEDLRLAEQWDRTNPAFPAQVAATIAAYDPPVDPIALIGPLQAAATLGPNRADTWGSLARAFEAAGQDTEAFNAYGRALELFPRSPELNWDLANLLIRGVNPSSAVVPLRIAVLGDSRLRTGALDLAWRAKIPIATIEDTVPDESDILSTYLDYLATTGRLDAAATVWTRLVTHSTRFNLDAPWRYFDALLAARRLDELSTLWTELALHDADRIHWQPKRPNLMMNGGFEDTVLEGGFDWRTTAIEGASIGYDAVAVHSGARSMSVEFDRSRNVSFAHVSQYVPVAPNTSYRFQAYVRTSGITTDSGPRIAIYDAFDHGALLRQTENLLGTTNWREEQLEFHTGALTRLIVVQISRPASQKLDSRISGTFWLDDVSLVPIP